MVMALSSSSSSLVLTPNPYPSNSLSRLSYPNPIPHVPTKVRSIQAIRFPRTHINPTAHNDRQPFYLHFKLPLQLASASVVRFLGFGLRICSAGPTQLPRTPIVTQQEEDEKLKQEFDYWKSKTHALTVPLRVVSLQNSVPQSWVKDFMRSQGKRLKFQMNLWASIDWIFNNLSTPFNKVKAKSASYMAADLVSVVDSWLSFGINKRLIEPIAGAEDQDWFKCLSHKWKVYLCRNDTGEIDPRGKIWAAPYRWATMVIACKKSKFRKHNLAPIELILFFKLI